MTTLRNKIGNLLIMGFDGSEIDAQSPVAQWLVGDGLGGVLLFDKDMHTGEQGKNLKNIQQIKTLINQLQTFDAQNPATHEGFPLLVAIDYEGGAVDRLAKVANCAKTLNALELEALSDAALEDELTNMAMTLKGLGFNLNFAPVVDLALNAKEGIIGRLKRSYSSDPVAVARVARKFVEIFNRYGLACSYKHFPGHGSAVGDTHEGFVDVSGTFEQSELEPYSLLLQDKDKAVMIMTAHVINKQLDSSGLPATLSHEILTGLLREKLGFDGVIISDDLQMQAIASHYSLEESLRLTLNAGADMVIFGNQLGRHSARQVIDVIERLVEIGEVSVERIEEAYARVMKLRGMVF